ADWCARAYGLRRDAIEVIHTGIDLEHFAPRLPKDSRPTIVFVGRLSASKGVESLLEAALTLAPDVPGLQLRLVGRAEPDFHDWLNARAASSGRSDLVDFVGYVGRESLPDCIA